MPDMKVPINPDTKEPEVDEGTVGFNLPKENLRCLIVLNDQIAEALSNNAGNAFFRAFVVENRETGEIWCKQRFRYKDGDSWAHMHLGPDQQGLSPDERVRFFVKGIERVLRTGMSMLARGAEVPEEAVVCFYPPSPDDSMATIDWLFQQDLIEATKVITPDGREVPISKEAQA